MRATEFDTCYNLAVKTYNDRLANGGNPKFVQVAGYKGDPTLADERWQQIPTKNWHHYVVIDDNTVWDPSYKQFGNTVFKYPKNQLKQQWDKVYIIK